MQVIEQFTQGKTGDDSLNEDKIVVTEHFIAVLDGVTSRRGQMLQGMTNGRFAAHVLAAEIARLPRQIEGRAAIAHLSERLLAAAETAAAAENKTFGELLRRPAAAVAIYSRMRREIWRVADPAFMIDGTVNEKEMALEENWCALRRAYIEARLAKGETEEFLRDNDNSWELLSPMMGEFKIFTNFAGPYGYGVINGTTVPDMHIDVYNADNAKEIVLASDGYPRVFATFEETERFLQYIVTEDPLMYRLFPQVKSVRKGYVSFDDRSYIRFMP